MQNNLTCLTSLSSLPPLFSLLPSPSLCLICILQGFRIDLTCKQLTVDFVNQSVLQISSQDVEGKRSDKTDFAEKLGAMNRRWQILQGLITEKVKAGITVDLTVFFLCFCYCF